MAFDRRQPHLSVSLTALLIVGVAGGSSACKDEQPATIDKQPPRSTKLEPPPTSRNRKSSVDEVPFHLLRSKLLDPGSGKKSKLRYQIDTDVATKLSSTAVVRISGNEKSATIKTGLAVTGSKPKSGPALRLGVVGLPGKGPDNMLARYNESISNTRVAADIDDRGQLIRIGGAAPLHKKREMAAFLVRFLVALPAEDVGVGARWEVKYAISRGGVFIAQTRTYTLKKLDGNRLSIDLKVAESAEPQPIVENGELLGSLIALKLDSQGSVEVDLAHPMTRGGQHKDKLTLHATVQGAQGEQEVFRESTSTVTTSATESATPTSAK